MIKNRDRQDPGHTSTETDRQTLDTILLGHIPVVYFLLDLRCGKCSVLLKIHVNKQIPLVFLFVELASGNYNIAKFSCRLTMNINTLYFYIIGYDGYSHYVLDYYTLPKLDNDYSTLYKTVKNIQWKNR